MDHVKAISLRLKSSLRRVILIYLVYTAIGAFAAIIWYIFSTVSLSFVSLCVILSTLWGLFQISFFMGYGLVEIPRSFRRRISTQEMLEVELCKIDWLD